MTNYPVRSPRSKLSAKGDKTQFFSVFRKKKITKPIAHLEFIMIMYIAGCVGIAIIIIRYKEERKKKKHNFEKSNWAVRGSYFVGLKTPC